ncbi:MAG TPA: hypothetical protein VNC50_02405 [Planctomycetia bacterium]|nr:hypothetical protein [Planctomycetia bacterium]
MVGRTWIVAAAIACASGCMELPRNTSATPPPPQFTVKDLQGLREIQQEAEGQLQPPKVSTEGLVSMANFYISVKRFDQADKCLEKAIALDSKFVPAYVAMARLNTATGRDQKASDALKRGLAIDGKSAALWNEVAVLRSRRNDVKGALQAANFAASQDPQSALYVENLAGLQALAGEVDGAVESFARIHSEAEASFRVANILYGQKQFAVAGALLERCLQTEPEHESAGRMLAALQAGPRVDANVRQASAVGSHAVRRTPPAAQSVRDEDAQ